MALIAEDNEMNKNDKAALEFVTDLDSSRASHEQINQFLKGAGVTEHDEVSRQIYYQQRHTCHNAGMLISRLVNALMGDKDGRLVSSNAERPASDFSKEDLELFRQWFGATEDLSSNGFLKKSDYNLARRLYDKLRITIPVSLLNGICEAPDC